MNEAFLKLQSDESDGLQLRTESKEGEDFVLVPDRAWQALYEAYDGSDVPRLSIELATDEEEAPQKKQFAVEVFLKKLRLYILPKVRSHLCLKKPSAVFVSRKASVLDLRRKIAQILHESKPEGPGVQELMDLARVWRLDPGETVQQIEREYDLEPLEGLPLALEGRVLADHEVVEEINVAESDVLLYEVKALKALKDNDCFAFVPKQQAKREKKSKNQLLVAMGAAHLNEEQLMLLPLERCLEPRSRGGLCGLQNLGNTCFMNSVVQCLANTEPLAKFFIFGCFQDHVNRRNMLGTRGRLAQAFSELLTDMYVGQQGCVSPWEVKNVIARRAVQFQGFAQHDSQEMLSFLLETLHEDLNDVTAKPYVEHKDFDGRSDAEVSAEYWAGFCQRDKSLFVDLFYGQLKSRVQCTVCRKVSISFDPFNMLSVPIPSAKEARLAVKYFPLSLAEQPLEFLLSVGDFVSVQELRAKVLEHLPHKPQLFVCRARDKSTLEILSKDKMISTRLDKGCELCFFERVAIAEPTDQFMLLELKVSQYKRSWVFMSGV